jgi:hypothetical protein
MPEEVPVGEQPRKRSSKIAKAVGGGERPSKRSGTRQIRRATHRHGKTRPCKSCGEPVLVGSRKCPGCGAPFVAKKGIGKILVVGVVILLLAVGGGFAGVYFGKPDLLDKYLPGVRESIDGILGKSPQADTAAPDEPAEDTPAADAEPGGESAPEVDIPDVGAGPRDFKMPGTGGLVPDVPEVRLDSEPVSAPGDAGTGIEE